MQPTDDGTLLRQYSENQSDEAFAALVTRHINLVYSVAFRQVGDPHQAEEITQAVFILLAKKAAQLRHDKAISSWLFQATRLTASNFVRGETRRHRREQEAHMQSVLDKSGDDVWRQISPLLDTAVASLSETDRQAIVLRFYEVMNLRDVGMVLGASEDAAEKRVSRAVERLREFFTKRGITVGASKLVAVISAHAVQAAPVGLAVAISTAAALAGTTIATTATATATQAIVMTTLQKTLISVTIAAVVGTGIYEAHQAATLRTEVHALKQRQVPLADQNKQLAGERDDATRQLAALHDENERLNRNTSELLKLRGEVAGLRREKRDADRLFAEHAQLRQNLKVIADSEPKAQPTQNETERLKGAGQLARALTKFAEQNQGRLPERLSDAQDYFPPEIDPGAASSNFEMVYLPGNLTGVPNANDTIILREKELSTTPDGRFSKAYAFADGHTQIRYSGTNDFTAWEEKWPTISKAPRVQSAIGTSVKVGTSDPQKP